MSVFVLMIVIARLYTQPDILCQCKQGRILRNCSLPADLRGGFLEWLQIANRDNSQTLFPDLPDLEQIPDIPSDRNAANYAFYWPSQPDIHNHNK